MHRLPRLLPAAIMATQAHGLIATRTLGRCHLCPPVASPSPRGRQGRSFPQGPPTCGYHAGLEGFFSFFFRCRTMKSGCALSTCTPPQQWVSRCLHVEYHKNCCIYRWRNTKLESIPPADTSGGIQHCQAISPFMSVLPGKANGSCAFEPLCNGKQNFQRCSVYVGVGPFGAFLCYFLVSSACLTITSL